MKFFSITSLLFIIILAACGPSTSSERVSTTNTIVPSEPLSPTNTFTPLPTETLPPTFTFTPEPTATETPQPIPDFMDEYIELGFDKVSSDRFLCFVIDETKIHYSPLKGIVYKQRVIRSWLEVAYIVDGEFRKGIILGYVRRGGEGANSDFTKITLTNSGSLISNPSVAFVKAYDEAWTERTPTEHTIACGTLGLVPPSEVPHMEGVNLERFTESDFKKNGVEFLYDGVFPVVDGKAQSVRIVGIGEVLPIVEGFVLNYLLVEK